MKDHLETDLNYAPQTKIKNPQKKNLFKSFLSSFGFCLKFFFSDSLGFFFLHSSGILSGITGDSDACHQVKSIIV